MRDYLLEGVPRRGLILLGGLLTLLSVLPFLGLMFLAIILMCFVPGIATALPDLVMGAPK